MLRLAVPFLVLLSCGYPFAIWPSIELTSADSPHHHIAGGAADGIFCRPPALSRTDPRCDIQQEDGSTTTFDISDMLLSTLPASLQSTCLFNPAVIHHSQDLFLW